MFDVTDRVLHQMKCEASCPHSSARSPAYGGSHVPLPVVSLHWAATHLAAAANVEPSFFDFLFSNGLTAELTDNRGYADCCFFTPKPG